MSNYRKFKVEACFNGEKFRVLVKGRLPVWLSGCVWTDYFNCFYETKQEALDAIERYLNRFTEVNEMPDGPARQTCRALQHSDQMVCGRCRLQWDVNDPDPPKCLTPKKYANLQIKEIKKILER